MAFSDRGHRPRPTPYRSLTLLATSGPWSVNYTDGGQVNRTVVARLRGGRLCDRAAAGRAARRGHRPARGAKPWLKATVDWYQDPTSGRSCWRATGPATWPRVPVGAKSPAHHVPAPTCRNIKTGDDRISFDVDRTGVPVLVKASYFPNWQASGAKGPYRVTPNLMVVVPTSKHVSLHYGYTPVDALGYSSFAPRHRRRRAPWPADPPLPDAGAAAGRRPTTDIDDEPGPRRGRVYRQVCRRRLCRTDPGPLPNPESGEPDEPPAALRRGRPAGHRGRRRPARPPAAGGPACRSWPPTRSPSPPPSVVSYGSAPHLHARRRPFVRWVREPGTFTSSVAAGLVDVAGVCRGDRPRTTTGPAGGQGHRTGRRRHCAVRFVLPPTVRGRADDTRARRRPRRPRRATSRLTASSSPPTARRPASPTSPRWSGELAPADDRLEIVVVDDGSRDGTADAARRGGADQVVEQPVNRGKGAAVRAGMLAARGRTVAFTDADLSYPPDQLLRLLAEVESGWDVVVGSRRHAPDTTTRAGRPPAARSGAAVQPPHRGRAARPVPRHPVRLKAFRSDVARLLFGRARSTASPSTSSCSTWPSATGSRSPRCPSRVASPALDRPGRA